MTVRKRKKNTRQRGSKTHGWGAKKKHRGAGNRGGRGKAGTGKRADSKKPSYEKYRYFGKRGFKPRKRIKDLRAISLGQISHVIDKWVANKLAEKKGDVYIVDLAKVGYDKVLSNGLMNKKVKIKALYASKKSVKKAIGFGCEIEMPVKKADEPVEKGNEDGVVRQHSE